MAHDLVQKLVCLQQRGLAFASFAGNHAVGVVERALGQVEAGPRPRGADRAAHGRSHGVGHGRHAGRGRRHSGRRGHPGHHARGAAPRLRPASGRRRKPALTDGSRPRDAKRLTCPGLRPPALHWVWHLKLTHRSVLPAQTTAPIKPSNPASSRRQKSERGRARRLFIGSRGCWPWRAPPQA